MGRRATRTDMGDGTLRVSYILGCYPSLTETFIDREIQQLRDRAVEVELVSIRPPDGPLSPSQQALSRRVRYLLPVSLPGLLFAHLSAAIRRPRTYFGTLVWLMTRPHTHARFRTALHFGTGVYAAWTLRDRRDVHVHAHFVDRAATVALVASRLLDTTYSVTAHAQEIYVRPVLLKERISEAAFAVTCTEYNRRHLARLVGPRVASRIVRLYHGLDLAGLDGSDRRVRPEDPLLLAVAQLVERKGLRYLIEACRLLVDRGRHFRCEIVGNGPLRGDLEEMVHQLGLESVVMLAGPLSYPDVLERYRRALALVMPCIVASDGDRDGIPNVILEAMAAGVPVISTPVSGIPEVVRDGETGLVVGEADPAAIADAVERLMGDGDLVTRLGEGGRTLVHREFDLVRNVERLRERFVSIQQGSHA
jgi:glycosyltransferase involved in cell wall biosynthesis